MKAILLKEASRNLSLLKESITKEKRLLIKIIINKKIQEKTTFFLLHLFQMMIINRKVLKEKKKDLEMIGLIETTGLTEMIGHAQEVHDVLKA